MRIIVIGGGAAGMMAALQAAENGADVILLEKNEKLGKKLYITGKGRCNVTNACERQDFFDHVFRNPRFLYSSYDSFGNEDLQQYLEERGLPLKVERGNRVFPISDKSSDVIRTLQRSLEQAGVDIRLHTEVAGLLLEPICEPAGEEREGSTKKGKQKRLFRCRGVRLKGGDQLSADGVILATGGLSYASTGSTGDGYRFAQEAGHSIMDRYPALVPFEARIGDGIPCERLQGLALKNISIQVKRGGKRLTDDFGELLFTHFGVSGPVILTASSHLTELLQNPDQPLQLWIDLKPAISNEQLDARMVREFSAGANRRMKNLAGSLYPAKMVPVILELAGIDPERCGREITREERARLLAVTKAFPVSILRTRGYSEAVITRGGISVREIDPRTMESRLAAGLYIAGEVLDVDASTGGYNLQIAWSTGAAAGRAAAGAGQGI